MSDTRELPAALLAAFQAETLEAIHLVEVHLSPIVYVTDWDHDITFGGNTYVSRRKATGAAFTVGPITEDPSAEEGGTDLRLSDSDDFWQGKIAGGADLLRCVVKVLRVEGSQLGDGTKKMLNTFIVDTWEQPERELLLHLKTVLAILTQVELPLGAISRTEFKGIPPE